MTRTNSDVVVTTAHLRTVPGFSARSGFCARGARQWFAQHDLDYLDFVRNGIPASRLEATGCAMAKALAEWARQEAAHGRRGR